MPFVKCMATSRKNPKGEGGSAHGQRGGSGEAEDEGRDA